MANCNMKAIGDIVPWWYFRNGK